MYLRAVEHADLSQVRVRPMLRYATCGAEVSETVLVRNVTGAPQTRSYGAPSGVRGLALARR